MRLVEGGERLLEPIAQPPSRFTTVRRRPRSSPSDNAYDPLRQPFLAPPR